MRDIAQTAAFHGVRHSTLFFRGSLVRRAGYHARVGATWPRNALPLRLGVLIYREPILRRRSRTPVPISSASTSVVMLPTRQGHSCTFLSRNAFAITETELKVIAALAIIGLSTIPKNG